MRKINYYLSFFFTNLIILLSIYSLDAQQWVGSTTNTGAINRSGRVGIGIGSFTPQVRLDIQGNVNPAIRIMSPNLVGSGAEAYFSVINTAGTYSNISQTGDVALMADGTNGNFIIGSRTNKSIFFTTGTASSEAKRMSILANGKVSIGNMNTSASGYKLFVEEGIQSDRIRIYNNNNPTLEIKSTSNAAAYFSVIDQAGSYSNEAQPDDIAITTGGAATGNLIIGSRSNKSILFTTGTATNWQPDSERTRMSILNDGKVKIGDVTTPGDYRLYVEEGILTEKIKVALHNDPNNWADYVFDADYNLMPLYQLKEYITKNNHLPNIPSSQELIDNGGVELMEMTKLQMEKIEELTLYMIQMNEGMEELKKENEALKDRLEAIEK